MKRFGMIEASVSASRKLSSNSSIIHIQSDANVSFRTSVILLTRTISSASDQRPFPSLGGGCRLLVDYIHCRDADGSYLDIREEEYVVTGLISSP
jgi:hypothetical protein